MRIAIGLVCSLAWLLYLGQLLSVVDFPRAQRLGLQEKASEADPLFQRLELGTARWDLLWFWTLPLAGTLMLFDHPWWPYAALVGGGAFVDTGGREGVKVFALRQEGVRTGSPGGQRLYVSTLAYLIFAGLLAIAAGLAEVL